MGQLLNRMALRASGRLAQAARRLSSQLSTRGNILVATRVCSSATTDVDMRRSTGPILGAYPMMSPETYVAPSATVVGQTELYDKVVVWYNAVVRGDLNRVTIGFGSHICDGAVVLSDKQLAPGFDASTYIASHCRIGCRAYVKGCTILDNPTIGDGAVVLEGALVEENAVVEAGSVVPRGARIPAKEVWGGNPVQFIRKLEYKEMDNPVYAARELWDLAVDHQDEFLPIGHAYQQVDKAEGL